MDKLRSIGKQSGKSVKSVPKKKRKAVSLRCEGLQIMKALRLE